MLGIQIANGYSPEARVHATLLGSRGDLFDAMVLMHDSPSDRASAARFATASKARVEAIDTGWSQNKGTRANWGQKAVAVVRFAGALREMLKLSRVYEPDIVYSCQQRWDCRAATILARRLNKPQIIHLHYIVGPWLGRQTLDRLRTCDHVVAVSDFIRREALRHGVASSRVTALLNSAPVTMAADPITRLPMRAELGLPADATVIGIIAQIRPYKGHADVVDAFDRISAKFPDSWLVIVGDGPLEVEIRETADSVDAKSRIVFTGKRSDVPAILPALDIFIHPSRSEPCALALMEASLAGLPVVAYADGGTPELIIDGVTGYLAAPGDRVALAEALGRLVVDATLRRNYGQAGRERMMTDFTPEKASSDFARLASALMAGHSNA